MYTGCPLRPTQCTCPSGHPGHPCCSTICYMSRPSCPVHWMRMEGPGCLALVWNVGKFGAISVILPMYRPVLARTWPPRPNQPHRTLPACVLLLAAAVPCLGSLDSMLDPCISDDFCTNAAVHPPHIDNCQYLPLRSQWNAQAMLA